MGRWTLDDIPWERFDRSKLDPEIVRIVKAASLVEYNGRAYAQHESTSRAAHLQPLRQQLLLRGSHRQKAEAKGTVCLDELQAGLRRRRVVDEAHRRIMMMQLQEPVAAGQLPRLRLAATDHDDAIGGRCDTTEQLRGEIGAGTYTERLVPQQPNCQRQHPAVQQRVFRAAIETAKSRIFTVADQVVDVWRDHIAVAARAKCGGARDEGGEIEVVDLADRGVRRVCANVSKCFCNRARPRSGT